MSSTDHLSELESLRSQVTDLSRALAERDQSMSMQRHQLEAEMQDLREQSHLHIPLSKVQRPRPGRISLRHLSRI